MKACWRRDRELVRVLLDRGADVNWMDEFHEFEWSGLHCASINNDGELMDLLLAQTGVDVNCTYSNGWTALLVAVYYNRQNCVELLRGVGDLDWNVRGVEGDYPVTLAVERGYADILRNILSVPGDRVDLRSTETTWPGLL